MFHFWQESKSWKVSNYILVFIARVFFGDFWIMRQVLLVSVFFEGKIIYFRKAAFNLNISAIFCSFMEICLKKKL